MTFINKKIIKKQNPTSPKFLPHKKEKIQSNF